MAKTYHILRILVLAFIFVTAAQGQNETHIYIAFGQSNMQGAGGIEQIDTQGISDRFESLTVVDGDYGAQGTDAKGQWRKAVPPNIISWLSYSNFCDYGPKNYLGVCIGLSPMDYFGRTLTENTPDNIKIRVIAVAQGDLALAAFRKTKGAEYFFV